MENHPETPHSLNSLTPSLHFRAPTLADGKAIFELIQACPPLDLNSRYLYFVLADHFADSCVLAEQNGRLVGFVSAYVPPNQPDSLFIWQVAVHPAARGQGLGLMLLEALLARQTPGKVRTLLTTIGPSNRASQNLFKAFAKRHGFALTVGTYLQAEDFGADGEATPHETHEAEMLYRLTPMT